ncbi:MAG: metallophosphoesterase [Patescibacteria group bacterium]
MSEIIKQGISYSFILSIPILVLSLILAFKLVSAILRVVSLVLCLVMLIVSWSYFIEPNLIVIKEFNIPMNISKSIIFVSDPHFSKVKNTNFATQLANKINSIEKADMVLWGGDWNENLSIEELKKPIAQLSTIKYPQYTVFGNHDFEFNSSSKPSTINGSTEFNNQLQAILIENSIKPIDNESIIIDDLELTGIPSEVVSTRNIGNNTSDIENKIFLTHEPKNIELIKNGKKQITFAGHSHCGQVKIPILTKYLYNNFGRHKSNYFEEFYEVGDKGKLFISCGLGETILPLRFLNPPTIYKINLN